MKRRYTIAADAAVHHEKIEKLVPSTFKCITCDSNFKSKGTLSRHMRSNKHVVRAKSLKGMTDKLTKENLLGGTGIIWGSVFWNSYFLRIQEIF